MEMGYLYLQVWVVFLVLMYVGKRASHMECLGKTSQLKNDCFGKQKVPCMVDLLTFRSCLW